MRLIRATPASFALVLSLSSHPAAPQAPPGAIDTRIRALLDRGETTAAVEQYDRVVDETEEYDPELLALLTRQVLSDATRDDERAAAIEACITLMAVQAHRCTHELALLQDSADVSPAIRLRAAAAELRTNDESSEHVLRSLPQDLQGEGWAPVVDAASLLPANVAVPLLARAASAGTRGVRYSAIAALTKIDDPQATEILREWSSQSSEPGHLLALAAIARTGDDAALARLKSSLPVLHGPDLLAAGAALASRGDDEGFETLRQLLAAPDDLLQVEAAAALARLGDTAGRERLELDLNSANVWVRLRTLERLRGLRMAVDQHVWLHMADALIWVRIRAAQLTLEALQAESTSRPVNR